ncbi:MAG: sugar phosphate isomerase/epimerase, partial [Planctomycetota bacterium]
RTLDDLGLACVVETGARFLLDPHRKHQPTLLDPDPELRARRRDFLRRCIDIAAELRAEAVSFWSGSPSGPVGYSEALRRLAVECRRLIDYAAARGVRLAFEPEPGMLIERTEQFGDLLALVDEHPLLGLTLDIGHVHCVDPQPIPDVIRQWHQRLFNVHIEDMRRGVHEHLRFGEGEIDFPPVLRSLRQVGYAGCLNVELSRHSHMAPVVMAESYAFLSRLMGESAADSD